MLDANILLQRQSNPLDVKINMSIHKIREWYDHWQGQVYVAFSGGKDSTVLLHLVRSIYPNVKAVFINTGLEYPEVVEFVKTIPNVEWIRPKMTFQQVIDTYGYPVVSKKIARMISDIQNPTEKNINTRTLYLTGMRADGIRTKSYKLPQKWLDLAQSDIKCSDKCCHIMKTNPAQIYERKTKSHPFIGLMAAESNQRRIAYLQIGCNSFKEKRPKSSPIAFWLESDIWDYIKKFNVPYCSIYDKGFRRTGCMFCMFGIHLEDKPNRFQLLKTTHPKLWDYSLNKLNMKKVLDFIQVPYDTEEKLNGF